MINIIAAVDRNLGIGKDNRLLAHIKPDMEYFKRVTKGNVVAMGYKTYMSLPIKPLPDRTNIVITSKHTEIEGAIVVSSIDELLDKSKEICNGRELFIIGGASVYKQMIPFSDKLYITHIFDSFDADVFFPEIGAEWEIESIDGDKENIFHKHPHVFVKYKKKSD